MIAFVLVAILFLISSENVFASLLSIYHGTAYIILTQLPDGTDYVIYSIAFLSFIPVYYLLYRQFQNFNSFFYKKRRLLFLLLSILFVMFFSWAILFSQVFFDRSDWFFVAIDNVVGISLLLLPLFTATFFLMRKSLMTFWDKVLFLANTLVISSWVFMIISYLIVYVLYKLFFRYNPYY